MAVISVCIDTNLINVYRKLAAVNKLEEWHRRGLIEITKAPTLTEELARFEGPQGQASREKAEGYSEGRRSFAFTQRSPDGRSTQRGGNTQRGPKASHWVHHIAAILFPRRRFEKLTIQQQGDVLQLAEHKINGWNYFVTNNSRDFFRHKEALRELGIVALSPGEAVEEIASLVAARIFGTPGGAGHPLTDATPANQAPR